ARLRSALQFYANGDYYYGCGCCFFSDDAKYVVNDEGKIAKQALSSRDSDLLPETLPDSAGNQKE
ncbi:MAG: hypothetical protein V4493_03020, partial [Pseudomonadota bacterium]